MLGDGDDLGALRFTGPILTRDGAALYPVPRNLIGRRTADGWQSAAVLMPGEHVSCDRGSARLPAAVGWRGGELVGSGPPDGWWATAVGVAAVLAGRPPDAAEVVGREELVAVEPRVGIARDRVTRTAADDALYAADHVRPSEGVHVVASVAGLPEDWPRPLPGAVVPFGGEGRAAVVRPATVPDFPALAEAVGKSRVYSVTFLSPAFLPAAAWQPGSVIPGLPGQVASACCSEPIRLGGWDSANRRPVAARSAVPAGSTWFLELDEAASPAAVVELHGRHFDPQGDGRWGYGRMAVGVWNVDGREGEGL